MTTFSRGVLLCLLLAAAAGCDRVTKHFAMTTLAGNPGQSFLADTVRLKYHENPGGFLGTGATWSPQTRVVVFQLANLVFLLTLSVIAVRRQSSRLGVAGMAPCAQSTAAPLFPSEPATTRTRPKSPLCESAARGGISGRNCSRVSNSICGPSS